MASNATLPPASRKLGNTKTSTASVQRVDLGSCETTVEVHLRAETEFVDHTFAGVPIGAVAGHLEPDVEVGRDQGQGGEDIPQALAAHEPSDVEQPDLGVGRRGGTVSGGRYRVDRCLADDLEATESKIAQQVSDVWRDAHHARHGSYVRRRGRSWRRRHASNRRRPTYHGDVSSSTKARGVGRLPPTGPMRYGTSPSASGDG